MRYLPILLLAFVPTCSCAGALTPQQQRAATVFQCRVAALTPYLDGVMDVEEFTREAILGRVDPAEVMARLGIEIADITAASQAWQMCDLMDLKAPFPAPGNKVL